ncbi:hypothetical protein, partial [Tistrella bauzanensis]|uniref:hypothetical protein n=1 Tax=Tistrella bauzanensis TaxID=657419 RepID=UPI001E579CF5
RSSVVFANHRESQAAEITQHNFRLGSQAIVLFKMLADKIDRPYLCRQIKGQAPGRSLEWFEAEVDALSGKF